MNIENHCCISHKLCCFQNCFLMSTENNNIKNVKFGNSCWTYWTNGCISQLLVKYDAFNVTKKEEQVWTIGANCHYRNDGFFYFMVWPAISNNFMDIVYIIDSVYTLILSIQSSSHMRILLLTQLIHLSSVFVSLYLVYCMCDAISY